MIQYLQNSISNLCGMHSLDIVVSILYKFQYIILKQYVQDIVYAICANLSILNLYKHLQSTMKNSNVMETFQK